LGLEIYKIYLLVVIIKEWGCFARQNTLDTLSADRQGISPGQTAPRASKRHEFTLTAKTKAGKLKSLFNIDPKGVVKIGTYNPRRYKHRLE
jgi:hypothetical protein